MDRPRPSPDASLPEASDRARGDGAYGRPVIRGSRLIDGTGALQFNEEARALKRTGGIDHTIKGGILFDAEQLLEDVGQMMREAKRKARMAPDADLESIQ